MPNHIILQHAKISDHDLIDSKHSLQNRVIKVRKVSVVIPVYNEKETIAKVLKNIKAVNCGIREILVVDDGSTDGTYDEARKVKGVKVIRHPYNIGNGAAVKTGIKHALGDFVLFMDADGQHNPDDIPKLLEPLGAFDMVIGARTHYSNVSKFRKIGNWLLIKVASYLSNSKIADLTSGFRVMRREKIMEFLHILPNEFSYPTTSVLAFLKSGYPIKYVPLDSIHKRENGNSKINPFRDGLRFVLIIFRIIMLFDPQKIFLPASLAMLSLGMLLLFYNIFILKDIQGSSVLVVTVGFFTFMFGLLADQIAHIRRELKSNGISNDKV